MKNRFLTLAIVNLSRNIKLVLCDNGKVMEFIICVKLITIKIWNT